MPTKPRPVFDVYTEASGYGHVLRHVVIHGRGYSAPQVAITWQANTDDPHSFYGMRIGNVSGDVAPAARLLATVAKAIAKWTAEHHTDPNPCQTCEALESARIVQGMYCAEAWEWVPVNEAAPEDKGRWHDCGAVPDDNASGCAHTLSVLADNEEEARRLIMVRIAQDYPNRMARWTQNGTRVECYDRTPKHPTPWRVAFADAVPA